jgi:hypothetical protein
MQGSSVHPQQAGTADAMPGSALSSLLRSIWSDPCLKFAIKTLAGDIPALDFIPSQDMNKGTTPNCSSSAYDGSRNHAQVDHVGICQCQGHQISSTAVAGFLPSEFHLGNMWQIFSPAKANQKKAKD